MVGEDGRGAAWFNRELIELAFLWPLAEPLPAHWHA
jgi:hypothetical protein